MNPKHFRVLLTIALAAPGVVLAADAAAPPAVAAAPATATTQPSGARALIEQTIPEVVGILSDRGLTSAQRSERLKDVMHRRADLPVLSRIMLGKGWDSATPKQRDEFVPVLADYLMSVYLPLVEHYGGENVRVVSDDTLERGDQQLAIRVSDPHAGDRQLTIIACRLRELPQGWRVIDVAVEGISVVRIFGAQFRPVLAREGMDGLIRQLRTKISQGQPASPATPAAPATRP